MKCQMPMNAKNGAIVTCTREARFEYIRFAEGDNHGTSSNPDIVVTAYCTQHDRAGGTSRLLRPPRWEYDVKLDTQTGQETS